MIFIKAPTRIDLAGGTLDIWPIYLLHPNSCTINMAIDLYVEITLQKIKSKKIIIQLNQIKEEISIKDLNSLPETGSFALINHIIKYFNPDFPFELKIKINTPPGSGLGTSSSLSLGLCKAFFTIKGKSISPNKLIALAMALETQILQLPTGSQDYLASFYGGINIWKYELTGWKRKSLSINYKELMDRSILCYVGKPHNSALSNWSVFKARLDKKQSTYHNLEKIKEAVLELHQAITKKDWANFSKAINKEWQHRKSLSKMILTPELEKAIHIALEEGASAVKACGAANGGCLYIFCQPDKKESISESLTKYGYSILPFNISASGLFLQTK